MCISIIGVKGTVVIQNDYFSKRFLYVTLAANAILQHNFSEQDPCHLLILDKNLNYDKNYQVLTAYK